MRCKIVILLALMLTGQTWAAIDNCKSYTQSRPSGERSPNCAKVLNARNNSIADSNGGDDCR